MPVGKKKQQERLKTLVVKGCPVSIKVMWLICNQLKQVRYLHWTLKLFRLNSVIFGIFFRSY